MSFVDAIRSGFQNYVTFSGRAPRSEYWFWTLFVILLSFAASILDATLLGMAGNNGPIQGLTSLAVLLPSIAMAVRRLHDRDLSGWWYLLILLPLIGWLVLLFFFVQRGTDGANRFGADPLGGGGGGSGSGGYRPAPPDPSLRQSSIPTVRKSDD